MKILYYNWAYFNGKNIGGGVGVYQKNIIDAFAQYTKDDIYFLSSGEFYSPVTKKTYIAKIKKQYPNCKSYAIINSTVIAPAWFSFYNHSSYLNEKDETMLNVLTKFIKKHGEFDVLHLNNLEGLPVNILKIKERFPKMKIVYSLHNYTLFCPLANLYDFSEHKICKNFENGCQCLFCKRPLVNLKSFKSKIKNFSNYISPIIGLLRIFHRRSIKRRAKTLLRYNNLTNNQVFKTYRKKNVEYINKYVDTILSVSKRVKDIATSYGIDPEKNYISYIGTKVTDSMFKSIISI